MKYAIKHKKHGYGLTERATGFNNFWNEILPIWSNGEEADWAFLLHGKEVSFDEIRAEISNDQKAWKAKKELTHKRVRVSVGATALPNTYRSVWVKK
jgi:hypothetical protein